MPTVNYKVLHAKYQKLQKDKEKLEAEAKEFITNHHFNIGERWSFLIDCNLGVTALYSELESLTDVPLMIFNDLSGLVHVEKVYNKLKDSDYTVTADLFREEVTKKLIRSII